MGEEIEEVLSSAALSAAVRAAPPRGGALLEVYAPYVAPSEQISRVVQLLARRHKDADVRFLRVNAQKAPKLMEKLGVASVPTVLHLLPGKDDGALHEAARVEGVDAPGVVKLADAAVARATESIDERIRRTLSGSNVMVFIKGSPQAPRCRFSSAMVALLQQQGVEFDYFDVLQDKEMREGLKSYSKWPTYPQLYAHRELIGGIDVVRELVDSGELRAELERGASAAEEEEEEEPLDERLRRLTTQADVMLFMKGTPERPRCGFSNEIVGILRRLDVHFTAFDVLSDGDVREGLKAFSKWPTYPQLYARGRLIGGVDVVRQLSTLGELKDEIASA